jgi:restriction system protein
MVKDRFYAGLSPEQLAMRTSKIGKNLLYDRIGWGKSYLRMAGLVSYPKRATVQITDKGRAVLAKGTYSLEELSGDKDYLAHEQARMRKDASDKDGMETQTKGETPTDLIRNGMGQVEEETKQTLIEMVRSMDAYGFEGLVLKLLKKMGYGSFVGTPKSGDGGVDGIINQDQLGLDKIFMQAKRYAAENVVREPEIRNFVGAMHGRSSKGIFVTTSSFDDKARQKAKDDSQFKIILVDGAMLVDLMYEYSIGVQTSEVFEIKAVDMDFFGEE